MIEYLRRVSESRASVRFLSYVFGALFSALFVYSLFAERAKGKATPKGATESAIQAATCGDTVLDASLAKTRSGTKQATLLALLSRAKDASIDELAEATGWQKHTVLGTTSHALKKRLGLTITSEKGEEDPILDKASNLSIWLTFALDLPNGLKFDLRKRF